MAILSYFLISLVSAVGILVGWMQSVISPEEMKSGRRYFRIMQYITVILIGVILHSIWTILLSLAVIAVAYKKISYLDYLLLGIIFFLSQNTVFLAPAAILIFLYGFPVGSLLYKKKGKFLNMALRMIIFLAAANLPFLLSNL